MVGSFGEASSRRASVASSMTMTPSSAMSLDPPSSMALGAKPAVNRDLLCSLIPPPPLGQPPASRGSEALNLEVRDSEKKALSPSIVPSPLFGLPPVKDEWGLTDLSAYKDSSLNSFKQAAFRSSTPEAAEKAVFLALHEGKVGYEPMTFPWLFPMGTGHFAQNRRTGLRFEEHVRHLLRQSTGVFLEDEMWLDFAVSRAAILRYATGLPPMYKEEQENGGKGTKLEDTHTTILNQFMKAFPKKAFSIRYLLGDEEFHGLAMIIMFQFTPEQRAEVIMK